MSELPDIATAFVTYAPALRRVISGLVKPDDVDDVISDVFLGAWRKRTEYEDRGYPLSAWLYAIARSRVVDVRRRYWRDRTIDVDVSHLAIPGPEEALDRHLSQLWVRECITRNLEGDQRKVIWLRFVADRSLEETAGLLNSTKEAVKALQHRAIAKLRVSIAPDDMPSMMAAFATANELPRCTVEGCGGRPGKRSGLCKQHRAQRRLSTRSVAKTQPCHAPNCHEYARFSDGYCHKHHARALRKSGDVSDPVRNADLTCAAEGCEKAVLRSGLCGAHYGQELRRRQGRLTTKPCRAVDCDRPRHARGFCIAHFEAWRSGPA